jgi:hypothetical protein
VFAYVFFVWWADDFARDALASAKRRRKNTSRTTDALKRIAKNKIAHHWIAAIAALIVFPAWFSLVWYGTTKAPDIELSGARSELALQFVYPKKPALLVQNPSSVLAREVLWGLAVWNVDALPQQHNPLPIRAQSIKWIRPGQAIGPFDVFRSLEVAPLIKPGDRIFGSASVNCAECARGRTYWLYVVWGESGWYSEIAGKTNGALMIPRGITNEQLKDTLLRQAGAIPEGARVPIKDWEARSEP